jgi:uncharacterized membrane protein
MRLRRVLFRLALVLAVAAVAHLATLVAFPRLIMRVATRRIAREAGVNRFYHAPRPTASFRAVVRPSPDISYSACVYDVSKGPLLITTPVPPSTMSVAAYSSNTTNFFVVNDRQVPTERLELILSGPSADPPEGQGRLVVRSPSRTGLVLIRSVIESDEHYAVVEAMRHETRCEPLP